MNLDIGKTRKLRRSIEKLQEGDSLSLTESIHDKDLLLYLGLTNDTNPLYIQHDYAHQAEYKRPIVPSILLMRIITSAISKHLPGPGSDVINFSINFIEPIFHYEMIRFDFEVIKIDKLNDVVTLSIEAKKGVLSAVVLVQPPRSS